MAAQVVSKPAVSADDTELVRGKLARDDTAFRTILKRHNCRLYRIDASTPLNGFREGSSLAAWQPTEEMPDLTRGIASGKLPGGGRLNGPRPARESPSLRTLSECGHLDEVPGASSREFARAHGCSANKRRR
jgi:hypothetical protein